MTWLNGIGQRRAAALGEVRPSRARSDRAQVDVDAFERAMVSEKVLAKHGASLHPALADMNAVAQTAAAFEPFRATQFGHALDRFYGALGRQLEKIEPGEQSAFAKTAARTLRSFITEVGPVPELMPAMATLSSMLEPRGDLDVDPKKHAAAAMKSMLELLRLLEGRDGLASMLHTHRSVLETIERRSPDSKASDRPALWSAANQLMAEALPRPGADHAKTAHLAALFFQAAEQHPKDPAAILEATKAAVFAEQAEAREAARLQVAEVPHPKMAAALTRVLDANQAGPPEILAAVAELARRTRDVDPALDHLAKLIELIADSPAIRAVLDHLLFNYPTMLATESAKQAIERAARANDPQAVPLALIRAHCAQHGGDAEALAEPVALWSKMPPSAALRASLALMTHLNAGPVAPALAAELLHVAPATRRMEDLTRFAERFTAIHPSLAGRVRPEDAGRIASLLARRPGPIDHAVIDRAAEIHRAVSGILKEVPFDLACLELADATQFGHDPLPLLYGLLKAPVTPPLIGVAVRIARELGKLDRDPKKTDFPKILEDWTAAIADPTQLSFASGARKAHAIRAKKSITSFLEAHPKLPVEVAITAGIHLSTGQLDWLVQRIGSTRSNTEVRVLRDLVFASVALERTDLIDAFRSSKSDGKSTLAAATLIAQHHRQGKLAELPIDRIIEGLAEGGDPATAIVEERAAGALGSLEMDLEGVADPAGAKLLESVQKEVKDLVAFFAPAQIHSVDSSTFREPLLVALRSIAQGTWPRPKFEGEIADRQLGDLDPKVRALWADESITPLGGPGGNQPELVEAMQLVRGLKEALPAEWDREMLEQLTAERAEKIGAFRRTKRGSTRHRAIARQLAPLSRQIAMVELKLQIERQLGAGADVNSLLLELKPYLAIGAARHLGSPGVAEALARIAEAAEKIEKPGRSGVYAVDESRLDAYLTSFGGSCIHPSTGFNRASLVELIMGPQYKMGRVMDGEKTVGRTIFRLLPIELPNGYQGYALRMDKPVLPTSWSSSPPDEQMRLMYRHGLSKAMAMGVPFMISEPQHVTEHAQAVGCEVIEGADVKLWIDKGHTGMHHNQGMYSPDYFIGWPGLSLSQTTVRPDNAEDLRVERNYKMTVIMPPR